MAKQPPKKHIIDVGEDPSVALDIDPALVEFIILKARAFDGKTLPVEPDPGSNPSDDGDLEILGDYPTDQTETELRDAIEQLSDDAATDLVAMFWVGRGDFSRDEWEQARELAVQRSGKPRAAYLMGEPNLGDFLEEGIISLGYSPQDYGP
jgi:hypothetical protein